MRKNKLSEVDKKFDEIEAMFNKLEQKNKEILRNAQIKPIHDRFPFAQNGISAFIAPMGSGKSYTYLKLAAKQEVLFNEPFFELIVICSTSNKFDETVNTYKEVIKKSKLVAVKDTQLLDWLNKYMRRILKYNSIIKYINSNFKKTDEEIERLFTKHNLNNNKKQLKYIAEKLAKYQWRSYPHRCWLILDDFASHPLIRSKETEMSRLLKKLRHFNINVTICVQTVKSIPKDIKRTLSDIVLFNGISKDDFYDLIKESPASVIEAKKLWQEFSRLKDPHATFTIHIKAKRVIINQKVN